MTLSVNCDLGRLPSPQGDTPAARDHWETSRQTVYNMIGSTVCNYRHVSELPIGDRVKWGFSKNRANHQIGAAQVVAVLMPIGIKCDRESVVRPLVGLKPEQIETAWKKAQELAGDGAKVTAKVVKKAVDEIPGIAKARPRKSWPRRRI